MELTSLPTESLYKFMAFSGLAIIFGTAAYAYKFLTSIGKQIIAISVEMNICELKSESLLKRYSREVNYETTKAARVLGVTREDLEEHIKERNVDEYAPVLALSDAAGHVEEAKDIVDAVKKIQQSMNLESLEISILNAEISGKMMLHKFESKQEKLLKIGCTLSILIGVVLAFNGFRHWAEMQEYVDQAVMKEAMSKAK